MGGTEATAHVLTSKPQFVSGWQMSVYYGSGPGHSVQLRMTKGGTDTSSPQSGYLLRKYANNEDPSCVVIVTM